MTTLKLTEMQRKAIVALLAVTERSPKDAIYNGWTSEGFGEPPSSRDFDLALDEIYDNLQIKEDRAYGWDCGEWETRAGGAP